MFFYAGGVYLKKKLQHILKSEKGEATYISSFIYILVAVILITFVINVFHIISVKQEMDHCVDQLVKQIQLSGGVNEDTNALFTFLSDEMQIEGLRYDIECSISSNKIQIGTPFYITVSGKCYLGGFWKLNIIPIEMRARGAGVSEHYWK